jgi:hypothetical protein
MDSEETDVNKRLIIGAALVLAVAAAASAWAAVPGGNGVINACYVPDAGAIRIIDAEAGKTCFAPGEKPLAWNVRGPKGDQGLQGIQGVPGPQGLKGDKGDPGPAAGAGDAYIRAQGPSVGITDDFKEHETVRVDLPAGIYALTAKGEVSDFDNFGSGTCTLWAGSSPIDGTYWVADGQETDGVSTAHVTLLGAVSLGSPTTASVTCRTTDDGVDAAEFKLLALKVGALK